MVVLPTRRRLLLLSAIVFTLFVLLETEDNHRSAIIAFFDEEREPAPTMTTTRGNGAEIVRITPAPPGFLSLLPSSFSFFDTLSTATTQNPVKTPRQATTRRGLYTVHRRSLPLIFSLFALLLPAQAQSLPLTGIYCFPDGGVYLAIVGTNMGEAPKCRLASAFQILEIGSTGNFYLRNVLSGRFFSITTGGGALTTVPGPVDSTMEWKWSTTTTGCLFHRTEAKYPRYNSGFIITGSAGLCSVFNPPQLYSSWTLTHTLTPPPTRSPTFSFQPSVTATLNTPAPATPTPPTPSPITPAPVTPSPVTSALATPSPPTPSPSTPTPGTTLAPTNAPVTPAPPSGAPPTPEPSTPVPSTAVPVRTVTLVPTTMNPPTPVPKTRTVVLTDVPPPPSTGSPSTPEPETLAPFTPAPNTSAPITPAPSTAPVGGGGNSGGSGSNTNTDGSLQPRTTADDGGGFPIWAIIVIVLCLLLLILIVIIVVAVVRSRLQEPEEEGEKKLDPENSEPVKNNGYGDDAAAAEGDTSQHRVSSVFEPNVNLPAREDAYRADDNLVEDVDDGLATSTRDSGGGVLLASGAGGGSFSSPLKNASFASSGSAIASPKNGEGESSGGGGDAQPLSNNDDDAISISSLHQPEDVDDA